MCWSGPVWKKSYCSCPLQRRRHMRLRLFPSASHLLSATNLVAPFTAAGHRGWIRPSPRRIWGTQPGSNQVGSRRRRRRLPRGDMPRSSLGRRFQVRRPPPPQHPHRAARPGAPARRRAFCAPRAAEQSSLQSTPHGDGSCGGPCGPVVLVSTTTVPFSSPPSTTTVQLKCSELPICLLAEC